MARKPITDMSAWPSLTLEGNLIAPAMVAKIDLREATEQTEESYGIRKGLTIREEVSMAFRVGQSHFDAFAKIEHPSADATRRFIKNFLKETLGFNDLADGSGVIACIAGEHVPVVVVPPSEMLDKRSPTLSTERSRSPAFALQDYLNEKEEALWGLVTNGTTLRLMRDNASLTRPAYIEADLAQIFANEDAASFAALWLMIHRSRFGAENSPATDCALERWRDAGSREGEAARDRLADQVQVALRVLGSGFLEANPDLSAKLKSGEVNLTDWFNELLRLVYRLIFLMVAEDRNLLHPDKAKSDARKLYAEGYSLALLRTQCFRAATWNKHHDRYEGIKIVFRSLTHGQEALALPALGGLFSGDKLPHLKTARLRNKAFMEALYRLSWLSDKTGMIPVNWRAMETEELGSVYESLLELQPQLGDDGKTLAFASEAAEQKGNQRKTTGSYYTPDSLVQALLDTALDPVLDKTETEANDPADALLKLSVIDPACGSGHFLLAAARRIATRLARIRADGTPSLADFRHALRDVARSCLHGVDRNPMAVELTKVALWIETVDPGLPLGFFDGQIRCGDALLGVFDIKVLEDGIPDTAFKPLTGDDTPIAAYYKKKNKTEKSERARVAEGFGFNRQQDYIRAFAEVRALPENTLTQVETKAVRLRALSAEGAGGWTLVRACDLYVAAFLLTKAKGGPHAGLDGLPRRGDEMVPTSGTLWEWLRGVSPFGPMFGAAVDAALTARAFHWPLEFPDIMQRGGFDVVLGNPPWERIKLQEQEFFAALSPEIANAANKAARDKLIKALATAPDGSAERALSAAFSNAKRESEASGQFARIPAGDGGRFPLSGQGDINTYALFSELAAHLTNSKGRSGIIVPSEILSSDLSKEFFQWLIQKDMLRSAIGFENEEFIFPGIANVNRFSLLTLGAKAGAEDRIRLAFYLRRAEQLAEPLRFFTLSADEISLLNPNSLTCPVFRTRIDADITLKIYDRVPILLDENQKADGNQWFVSFLRMFDMANDSDQFQEAIATDLTRPRLSSLEHVTKDGEKILPLYEGKFIWHFDHRFSSYHNLGKVKGRGGRGLPPVVQEEYENPEFEVTPRYWMATSAVESRLTEVSSKRRWLLGWRDVANAKVERTMIMAIVPVCAIGHTMPLLFSDESPEKICGLIANLNSMTLDFVARQSVGGTHLTYSYLKQFAVLPPSFYTELRLAFITPKVLELTYTSHSLAPFARDLGHDGTPFAWDEDRRAQLRADLDAFYARAYGLTLDELRYILDPADVKGPDYPSETFRVLKEKEIRHHGEYRTQRLVLAAWDRMEADGTFDTLGMADTAAISSAQSIHLLPLEQIPVGAWAWAQGIDERDRVRTQLRAMAGILPNAADPRRVRLAALACLHPGLLNGFLSATDQAEWQRIVGQQAALRDGVAVMTPPTNAAWGAAYNELVSAAVLDVSPDGSEWNAGPRLDKSTLHVDDPAVGRALFAWSRLQAVDMDQGLTQLPTNIIPFIRENRLAA